MAPIKHGQAGKYATRLYRAWCSMRSRCLSVTNQDYALYGGRGITVYEPWNVFETFASEITTTIGEHPGKGWTIDRVENNEGYKPGNIRWATQKTQCRNQRRVKLTVEKAAAIRAEYDMGNTSYGDLAWTYGVTKATIAKVITGRTWL